MNQGFIKLNRTSETLELLKDPNAFALLTVIALRARRTDEFNLDNLRPGEALIGDHDQYGMTRQQYRSAQRRLGRWGLAAFKPTPNGTVATLLSARIYDIGTRQKQWADNQRTTILQPFASHEATTDKKEKKDKNEKNYCAGSDERRLAELLLNLILEEKPDFRRPDVDRWAVEIGRMIRLDRSTPQRIEAVIRWCRRDAFWRSNILSTAKLRKHFDRLELQMGRDAPKESFEEQVARLEREGLL